MDSKKSVLVRVFPLSEAESDSIQAAASQGEYSPLPKEIYFSARTESGWFHTFKREDVVNESN